MEPVVDTFLRLVRIDSPSGEEERVADFIVSELKPYAKVKKDAFGNVYAFVEGNSEKPLFIAAHMDTVEPGRGIQPQIKDGSIVPSGNTILGVDNKASVAAAIELAKSISKDKKHVPLELIFTRFEETTGLGAANFDYKLLKSTRGMCFDIDRPMGVIIIGSPFYERFDIEIIGKSSHASTPENAINALTSFASLMNELKVGKISEDTVANIGIIQGGTVRNTIPGSIIAKGEVRSFSERGIEEYKKMVGAALERIKIRSKIRYKMSFVRENPGYDFVKGSKEWAFIKHVKERLKLHSITAVTEKEWAVSDANIFNSKGLTCINLSNGGKNPHTNEETISIKDLVLLQKIMESMISP